MAEGSELHSVVAEHTADIQVIKSKLGTLEASTLDNGRKLDKVIEAVNRAGSATMDNIAFRLAVVKDMAVLVAMAVAAIVYVSSNAMMVANYERAKDDAVKQAILEYRLSQLVEKGK